MNGKAKLGIAAAIILAVIAIAVWRIEAVSTRILSTRYPEPANALAVNPARADAKEGARLAKLDGCTACHGRDLTGWVMVSGPFGTRFGAPNLTAMVRHLSDAQLAAAIRYGVKPDGTSVIDMPVSKFLMSSDDDIAAIIAYLRTLPEKPSKMGRPQWGFEGRAMLAMGLMQIEAPMVKPARRGPKETPTAPQALGRYVAQVQCSGCHGPDLGGNPDDDSPDLRKAVTHYTEAAFVRFFATGNAHKDHPTRVMTQAIKRQFKYLTKDEVQALYTYLATSKPASSPATP